jgi:putative ABC transport system permease protein
MWLGQKRLSVGGVLLQEPDRGAGFMNFAPRVMMHRADLDATGLVQPASRITWRFAVVGEPETVERFVTSAQERVEFRKSEAYGWSPCPQADLKCARP